ncbi:MAG: 50S ribosomal protein L10 [Gammaproteobacteria bacterium]
MLTREKKSHVVEDMRERLASAQVVLLAENAGLSAAQMTNFRRAIKGAGGVASARVVKNTLAKIAMRGGQFEALGENLSGPLVFGVAEDPVVLAKVFSQTAKNSDKFILRGGALASGEMLNVADVGSLATIPSRDQLLANLVGTMQAPITGFVRTLAAVPSGFVRLLAAVQKQAADKN